MSTDERGARARWTLAALVKLIADARAEGWIATRDVPATDVNAEALLERARWAHPGAFEPMRVRLQLSPTQVDALWLLVCCEIEPGLARLVRALGAGDVLTVPILQRLVACASAGELSHADLAVLATRGLVETHADPRTPLYRRTIRVSDRVVELARGELALDRELDGICTIEHATDCAVVDVPDDIARVLAAEREPMIVAQGPTGSGRATLLIQAAAQAGLHVLRVHAERLARDGERLGRQLRAIERECDLLDLVPLVANLGALDERSALVERWCAMQHRAVLVTVEQDRGWPADRAVVIHHVAIPEASARANIWRAALRQVDPAVADELGSRYHVTPGTIVAAARAAETFGGATAEDAHRGLRAYLDKQLSGVATRVACTQSWDDVVLPTDELEEIAELVARVRHRTTVLDEWGFAAKVGRGHGVAALFSGPPGTGKTMVAGLIARELGLDLYQIDLSRVVSKYIGETEKSLARVFDAAESGHCIVLFDEADALFAKRSDVKSSNDRYANLEVNFLLQRMEQFRGICLLTTNHERAIDTAFRRRLSVHVRFREPDEAQREALWRAMIPDQARAARDLEFRRLAADFVMTGGYIRNAVLRAAYRAASEASPITMAHLWSAARAEYEALGKVTVHSAA